MIGSSLRNYIKKTESMIDPEKVGQISQFSSLLGRLPLSWQKGIAKNGAKTNPYMGFVVEPYSFFLSYEITDVKKAQELLPGHYKIVPTAMFNKTDPRPTVVIGAFNVHTSVFWGSRIEVYIIAENQNTGLLSWIIVDYETNTNSYDPGQGFIGATTEESVVTTSYRGDVIVDVKGGRSGNTISANAYLPAASQSSLDQRLWIEGNFSVDYGIELGDQKSEPFALIFDPANMASALQIPLDSVQVESNSFCSNYIAAEPFEACSFPYAQHFITTSMPVDGGIKNVDDLNTAAEKITGTRFLEIKQAKKVKLVV